MQRECAELLGSGAGDGQIVCAQNRDREETEKIFRF